ncbi:MAG TPA: helical backbone metal receptor [Gemmatimonadales bacterium]|nr:helical backbone metal receptor [Gemmatimonadales bacterium]
MSFTVRLIVLAIVVLAGCGGEGARADLPLIVIDDAGDTIRLPAPARRVVSLIPATTELLFAIGAGPLLVGRTHWCDYPAAAAQVPDLGDGMNPNLEAVVAARPDLVVLYHSGQNGTAAARLRSLGIPALQVRSDRLADVPRLAAMLGPLVARAEAADSLARTFERELRAATVPPPTDPPSVFLLVWDQPPMTVGRGSYLTELIERAGAVNVYADLPASSGQISIESAAVRDPDAILTLSETVPTFALRPEWQVVRAVRERRFLRISGSEFSRPGPRSPAAIRELAALVGDSVPPSGRR